MKKNFFDPDLIYKRSEMDVEAEKVLRCPIQYSLKCDSWRYQDLQRIEQGGMKVVYTARDTQTDRIVAYVKPIEGRSEDSIEQFLFEARLTAYLDHPHIIPVYDVGLNPDGEPFFAMKLMDGQSLADVLKKRNEGDGKISNDYGIIELIDILLKVCDAVAYAHARGVLHLDINPTNIQIGKTDEVQLCDWGLARFTSDKVAEWDEGGEGLQGMVRPLKGRAGTPGYMAPEQAVEGGDPATQSDVYALGVVLYKMLTGKLPVAGANAREVIENTRLGNVIPAELNAEGHALPHSLSAITMKALALDLESRYQTVNDMRQDLLRYTRGFLAKAETMSLWNRFSSFYNRNKLIMNTVVVAFIIVLALTVAFLTRLKEEQALTFKAQEERENVEIKRRELASLIVSMRDYANAESLLKVIDNQLKHSAEGREGEILWAKKAMLHFVLQEFSAAVEVLPKADLTLIGYKPYYVKILEEIMVGIIKLKPDDSRLMTEEELCDLIVNFSYRGTLRLPDLGAELLSYLYFHHRRQTLDRSPKECFNAVMLYLRFVNGKLLPAYQRHQNHDSWRLKPFGQDGRYELNLAGFHRYRFLIPVSGLNDSFGISNILKPLNLGKIDFEDGHFESSHELSGLKLDELALSRAIALNQKLVKRLGLKRMIVRDPVFMDDSRMDWYKGLGVEVIIEED